MNSMNSRHEPRFRVDQRVTLTLLGEVERAIDGRIVNVSGRGMCVDADQPVSTGSAVQIEFEDVLVLAEVVYCRTLAGHCQIGMALKEVLYHGVELTALLDRLLGRNPAVSDNLRQRRQ
jgi:PilZ domain-containing protein